MKETEIRIKYQEYGSEAELPPADRALLKRAHEAANRSYSPYSHFRVGAAVQLANGEVIEGSNQENGAYPSGTCAERVALFYASSRYPGVAVRAIAITARSDHFEFDQPVTPCGACRQVMIETENRQQEPIRVIMQGEAGKVFIIHTITSLLPLQFDSGKLRK